MKTEATKTVKTGRQTLRVLEPICINGQIMVADKIIEVSQAEAVDLIQRRKAMDATAAEVAAAGAGVIAAPIRNEKWQDVA